jgi:hypothetical protein
MKIVVLDSAKQHLIEGFSFYAPQSSGWKPIFSIRYLPT